MMLLLSHSPNPSSNPGTQPLRCACRRAKEKRERLRSAHLAPDYIPLGGAAGLTAASNAEAAARLRTDRGDGGGAGDAHSDEDAEAEDALRMQFMGADRSLASQATARARRVLQARICSSQAPWPL